MDLEIKTKWVEALRSGIYDQGRFDLRTENSFCCLGVLCDIIDPEGWVVDGYSTKHRGQRTVPAPEILDQADLPEDLRVQVPPPEDPDDDDPDDQAISLLVTMNDEEGKTFEEIADWIEEKL